MKIRRLLILSCLALASTAAYALQGNDLATFEAHCRSVGGEIRTNAQGSLQCYPPSSTSSGTSGANPYTPLVDGLLKLLFTPNNNSAAKRRAAMLQALQAEREDAMRRQQAGRAQQIDAVMQRLLSGDMGLKGMDDHQGLQLKLSGEKRPLGMEVYQHPNDGKKRMGISGLSGINLDNETPSTTKAQLSLKVGDEATRSQRQEPPKPVAPQSTTTTSSAASQTEPLSPEAVEMAKLLSELTPAQQQTLLAAVRSASTTQPAASVTSAAPPAAAPKHEALSLKLGDAQQSADNLRAAAASDAAPEQLKQDAEKQFNGLQQVTSQSGVSSQPSAVASAPQPPSPANLAASEDPCKASANSDTATVDLRCAKQPLVVDPRQIQGAPAQPPPTAVERAAAQPGSARTFPRNPQPPLRNPLWDQPSGNAAGKVEASEDSDLKLLFVDELERVDQLKKEQDRKESEKLLESFQNAPAAQRAVQEFEGELLQATLRIALATPVNTRPTAELRQAIVNFYAPEAAQRYHTDVAWAARADRLIEENIGQAKKNAATSDRAAFDRSLEQAGELSRRLTPAGQRPDAAALLRNPAFVGERDRIIQTWEAAQQSNAHDAQVRLLVYLELGFNGLKNGN